MLCRIFCYNVAKADGKVSADEIRLAERVMDEMQLSQDMRRAAINLFNQGKTAGFPLAGVLAQFRQECHGRTTLIRLFLEIQSSCLKTPSCLIVSPSPLADSAIPQGYRGD